MSLTCHLLILLHILPSVHQTGNAVVYGRCTYLAHHELESEFISLLSLLLVFIVGAAGCCMAFPETGLCPFGGFGSRWMTMEYPFVQV